MYIRCDALMTLRAGLLNSGLCVPQALLVMFLAHYMYGTEGTVIYIAGTTYLWDCRHGELCFWHNIWMGLKAL